jgi:hypothetical protein
MSGFLSGVIEAGVHQPPALPFRTGNAAAMTRARAQFFPRQGDADAGMEDGDSISSEGPRSINEGGTGGSDRRPAPR